MNASEKSVLAVVAHPDDIEFIAAGTMLLLKESGWQTHYLCLSGGDCGSVSTNQSETRRIRREEAIAIDHAQNALAEQGRDGRTEPFAEFFTSGA